MMRWQARDPWSDVWAMVSAAFSQNAFRFRNDDGSETSATWMDAENTDISPIVTANTAVRLRVATQETAGGSANNTNITLQFQVNGGTWTNVDGSTTAVVFRTSPNVSNQTATTDQLTTPTGSFVAGAFISADASAARVSFAGNDHTENEWSLNIIEADLASGDVINFRTLVDGATITYGQTPTLTVLKTHILEPTDAQHDHTADDVTLSGLPLPPLAPTLVSPADNSTSTGENFSWQFNQDPEWDEVDSQSAFAFRRTESSEAPAQTDESVPSEIDSASYSCAYSNDGTYLAVGNNDTQRLWVFNTSTLSLESGTPTFTALVIGVRFSPDDTQLAVTPNGSTNMRIVTVGGSWTDFGVTLPQQGRYPEYSADGAFLAVPLDFSPGFTVFDTSGYSTVSGLPSLGERGFQVAWSPDGAYLAIAVAQTTLVRVFDTSDWSEVTGLPTWGAGTRGAGVDWSPDGNYLAMSVYTGEELAVLDTSDWSKVTVESYTGVTTSTEIPLKFSPSGDYLAFGEPSNFMIYETTGWTIVSGTVDLGSAQSRDIDWRSDNNDIVVVISNQSPSIEILGATGTTTHEWWDGSAWVTSETFITSTDESLTLPQGSWT